MEFLGQIGVQNEAFQGFFEKSMHGGFLNFWVKLQQGKGFKMT